MFQPEIEQHPLLSAVCSMEHALTDVVDVDPMFMSTEDKAAAMLRLSSVIDRGVELQARLMARSDDVAERDGARDPAAWLTFRGRRERGECRRRLLLGLAFEKHAATARALRDGKINVAQAEAIVHAVQALPEEVEPAIRVAAEERLLVEAGELGPRELRICGRRILAVVAPEVGERIEEQQLEREEREARRRTSLRSRCNGDGTTDFFIRVPDHVARRLHTYLEAYASPRREGAQAAEDRRPYDRRMGEAFIAFLEGVDPHRMPLHGGDATTVTVTVDLDTLRGEGGVAYMGDEPMTAAQARRMACTAGIIPVVLGGEGQVLDLGRMRRFYGPVQRRALAVRQKHCRAEGCTIPAAWCEAHHGGDPWSRGGRTDLADADLLCSFHHHRAHDPLYVLDRLPDGSVRFTRRT